MKAVNAHCAAADACGQTRARAARWGSSCRDAAARKGAEGCPATLFEGELSFAGRHLDRCGTRACQWPASHCGRWRVARQGCKRPRVLRPVVTARSTAAILEVTQNLIAEVEALAVAVALHAWRSRQCLDSWTMKEQGRQSSSSESLANCVDRVTRLEIDLHLAAWWERVPSKSNLGDPPSRGIVLPLLPGWPTPCCTSVAAALQDLHLRIASQCSWEGRDVAFLS